MKATKQGSSSRFGGSPGLEGTGGCSTGGQVRPLEAATRNTRTTDRDSSTRAILRAAPATLSSLLSSRLGSDVPIFEDGEDSRWAGLLIASPDYPGKQESPARPGF